MAHVPSYFMFKVYGGVRAERFKVTLGSVSDCDISQFFAGEWVKIQCVVVWCWLLGGGKGSSVYLPFQVPLHKSHAVPVCLGLKGGNKSKTQLPL